MSEPDFSSNTSLVNSAVTSRSVEMVAASFTPMKSDGTLDLDVIESVAERMDKDGVSGVFIAGTTGESMSLTVRERKELAVAWRQNAGKDLKLFVHVGHASICDASELAAHAQSIGVDAVSAIGPTFFAAPNLSAFADFNKVIASASPELPYYYYHLPSMSHSTFLASDILVALKDIIPNFAGIKFTHEDLGDFKKCVDLAGDDYNIYFGRDELFLDGLKAGAKGAIGSTYNFATPYYHKVADAFFAGDVGLAAKRQAFCTEAIDIMCGFGGLPAIRATANAFGLKFGTPRLPLRALSNDTHKALIDGLTQKGYLDGSGLL